MLRDEPGQLLGKLGVKFLSIDDRISLDDCWRCVIVIGDNKYDGLRLSNEGCAGKKEGDQIGLIGCFNDAPAARSVETDALNTRRRRVNAGIQVGPIESDESAQL